MANLIYRNDDFNWCFDLDYLKEVHGWFEKHRVFHTIAVQGITNNRELIDYIKNGQYWDVQIHCWSHDPYRDMDKSKIYDNLKTLVDWIVKELGRIPTKYYPPWGRTGNGPLIEEACQKLGLKVETDCAFINYYAGAIANGEEYFKTAVAQSNWFIPYAKWDRVYFHLGNKDQVFILKYLIPVTADFARGDIDHVDFEAKKKEIEELKMALDKARKGIYV